MKTRGKAKESQEKEPSCTEWKTIGITAVSHQKPHRQKAVVLVQGLVGGTLLAQNSTPSKSVLWGKKGGIKTFSDKGKLRDLLPADLP